ncbi:FAD-binding oxidoreductase [Thalassobacillus sp. CUG 92003]|uniref:NAD(P)/FAD-dependent oxidoreductase n=1 Tax=Thalassobacillus sp. CUG 92003 TaxID=2736641 RepID=UPI0015E7619A|nr:FAD-dependent oxidoreductase [Thalassobacillus sp. CUG 92003]
MENYIVVGAGVLGASTAYHLAKSGADVTVVDREDQGQATRAAAGIICPWLSQRRNKAWYRIVKGGARYYPALVSELEADGEMDTGYARVGALSLHTDEEKLIKMEERAHKRREDAPEIGEITRLTPEETKRLVPVLAEEYGAVHVSGGARVNGEALLASLIHAAKKHGARFVEGDAALQWDHQRVTGVMVGEASLKADHVIVTAGAWGKELLQPLGMNFLVTTQKAQIVHVDMPHAETTPWPVVMPPNDQYLLSYGNGRVIMGATHENHVGLDYRVTAGGLHEIFDKALTVAPGLANSTMRATKVGFRPFTPGFLPVFGSVPDYHGLWVANGLGASGLTMGPYLGAELAKLVRGLETELDPADYDVNKAIERES